MTTAWADARMAALDTIRVWSRHWHATTGPARADARAELGAAIAHFRRFHLRAERAAVAQAKQQRAIRPQSLAREGYERAWAIKQGLR